jgi:hypothetical protein
MVDETAIDVLRRDHATLQELFGRVSSPDEDRPKVLKELMQTLETHLDMEKQVLLPVIGERLPDGANVVERLTNARHDVEGVLTLLARRKVNSPDVPELVTQLMDLTDAHVADADANVLPALEAALDAAELTRLAADMTSDELGLLTHSHPAVPDAGPLAGVAHKAAEIVDRVRDRSTDVGRTSS